MKLDLTRTIVAIGSGIAPARRSVVRISGRETLRVMERLLSERPLVDELLSHDATTAVNASPIDGAGVPSFQPLRHAKQATRLDVRLRLAMTEQHIVTLPVECYWWPNSRSYTGEPSAELHVIGSVPIVERLVETVIACGAAPAERGEFTLRSFLAGKIDLTQAEAVLGVIEADSEHQLQWALENLAGNLSQPVRHLRDLLMQLLAHLEAGLDFVEEDIEFISRRDLLGSLETIRQQLESLELRLTARGGRSRIPTVVLAGQPNSGKSTLFNLLVGTDRVIVSDIEGTTRDVVSMRAQVGGQAFELNDTAGVEELAEDSPRGLAQAALVNKLRHADLVLLCIAASATPNPSSTIEWNVQQFPLPAFEGALIYVGTKFDLGEVAGVHVRVSAFDDASIDALREYISVTLAESQQQQWSDAMHQTAVRCRQGIQAAGVAVQQAIQAVEHELGEEIIALELRSAMEQLSSIIGEIHNEDILGEIFGRFCIGK